jgi:hypothetical protein
VKAEYDLPIPVSMIRMLLVVSIALYPRVDSSDVDPPKHELIALRDGK